MLVHIYQMELVGFNQINMVKEPEYVRIQNLNGYGRIAQSQYYFCPGEYDSKDNNDDSNDTSSDGRDN